MSDVLEVLREAFEDFISSPPFEKSIFRRDVKDAWPGQYCDMGVELAWEAWQESSKQQDAALRAEVERLRNPWVKDLLPEAVDADKNSDDVIVSDPYFANGATKRLGFYSHRTGEWFCSNTGEPLFHLDFEVDEWAPLPTQQETEE